MKLQDAVSILDEEFSIKQSEDFDNVGLICGNPAREITGILVCHDALENVVDEAIANDHNLIISFHPIIFSGLKSLTGKNYVERSVLKAIENKISIYAVHTAFDNDYFGLNYKICEELGLINQRILMPKKDALEQLVVFVPKESAEDVKEAVFAAGAGNIGFYDECSFQVSGSGSFRPLPGSDPTDGEIGKRETTEEQILYFIFESFKQKKIVEAMKAAHPYEEVAYQIYRLKNENQYTGLGRYGEFKQEMGAEDFLAFVKEKFKLEVIRHSPISSKKIRRVGVLGGSGASGISAALAAGCDAYVTGDIKYHEFYKAEGKMMICDIGHFESEQFVVGQLHERLSDLFPKFAVSKSLEQTNPVNYFF